ncbi:MAG: hypothetical protein M1835_000621 [Candelina submexicana]|nr:MAG: hypothetical protein M1835_000621 [Candelina submexicana]
MEPSTAYKSPTANLRHIPSFYNHNDSQASALRLILTLFPDWEQSEGKIEFVRFKDGITNTLLKAIKGRPGYTEEDIDKEAVLLRAYGNGTEVLIDRDREAISHSLLAQHNLAPPLLARFQNGLLYRFIRGRACISEDLTKENVWRAVARRLAQWHAKLPVISTSEVGGPEEHQYSGEDLPQSFSPSRSRKCPENETAVREIAPGKPLPNLWTVLQKWILVLPVGSDSELERQATLQTELKRLVVEFGDTPGLGKEGLVFAHCDLLSGNVIVHPSRGDHITNDVETVSFIDYEYATPAPAAFDIANHFAEWGGFECDFTVLPTRSQRRGFLKEYVHSYDSAMGDNEVQQLFDEVDHFRGVPGFYWGIWALIQATISQIDFDYASYAEIRLGEYWAWREEVEGTRAGEKPLRERRWAEE